MLILFFFVAIGFIAMIANGVTTGRSYFALIATIVHNSCTRSHMYNKEREHTSQYVTESLHNVVMQR